MERKGRNYYLRDEVEQKGPYVAAASLQLPPGVLGLGFSSPLPLNSQLYITREAAELEAAAGLTRITLSASSLRV
uniref:Uncharacterized protein n=1 Tax=Populus trichocarpa TaxID=3694 RepID=A0A2K2BQ44_POPTR